ncbi:hypothetical protein L195_g013321, partial [Trifolium pratense]
RVTLFDMAMSRKFDAIKDINDRKEIWKLAVKVESIWSIKKGQDGQVELLLRDVSGDTIHVIILADEVKKRKKDMEELMQLKTQTIKNFRVQKSDAKCSDHPFKLVFISGTKVEPNDDIPNMPVSGFNFKKFEEIKAGKFREDLLYDVIGAVHEIGTAQTIPHSSLIIILRSYTRDLIVSWMKLDGLQPYYTLHLLCTTHLNGKRRLSELNGTFEPPTEGQTSTSTCTTHLNGGRKLPDLNENIEVPTENYCTSESDIDEGHLEVSSSSSDDEDTTQFTNNPNINPNAIPIEGTQSNTTY